MDHRASDSRSKPQAFSCVRCHERKVKCDREYPCAACVRSKTECTFRSRPPPRRRARLAADEAILARLKYYEDLLRAHDIAITPTSADPQKADRSSQSQATPHPNPDAAAQPNVPSTHGDLIVDQGRSRFIENKLWSSVSDEFHHSRDALTESESGDDMETPSHDSVDLILGATPLANREPILHPSPAHIRTLWQIFLTNVNPLMKIIHQPTVQRYIEAAIADIDHVSRGIEALLFAIYGAAILSMREGECQATFGESRSDLQSRYRLGIQRALNKAQFMRTSDLTVLQAFVIHLLTLRQDLDARTLWVLSGIANRIARGMGMHRDDTTLGLSPFNTEMRRRIWLQINILDSRAAELSGFGALHDVSWWDSQLPSNINDDDIWPEMKEKPVDQAQPTEMTACLIRYEIGRFWREKLLHKFPAEHDLTRAVQLFIRGADIEEKDAFIDEFEQLLERKYLKQCDQSIPLQNLAVLMAQMIITSMKLIAHHPRRYATVKDMPDSERQFLWQTSLTLIGLDNRLHSYHSLQKFNWHIDVEFQWQALIVIFGELRARPIGDGKDDVWSQIEDFFRNHSSFITNQKKVLHIAITNMCLKAWHSRERAQLDNPQGSSWLDTPQFISQLRKQKKMGEVEGKRKQSEGPQSEPALQNEAAPPVVPSTEFSIMPDLFNTQFFQPGNMPDLYTDDVSMPLLDDMTMDWQGWDMLMHDFETPILATSAEEQQWQNMG